MSDATRSLERDLRAAVRGDVHFDDGHRAIYSTDAANYRQVPIAVILPRDAADAQAAIAVCHRHGAPVTPRGGGTSLSGASCNHAVIFDYSKYMHRILEIDVVAKTARVEPGVVLDDLRTLAEGHGLTFGPAPATHNRCAIGGMFGNNSCGMPAQFAGRMEENVYEVEVLLHDGTRLRVGATSPHELERIAAEGGRRGDIYAKLQEIANEYGDLVRTRFPAIPRRVSGYNLNQLLPENGFNVARALIGSEGTIVHVLELLLRLVPNPRATALAILAFDDIATAADHVPLVNEHLPHAIEGMDETLFANMQQKGMNARGPRERFGGGHAWLLVQFGADTMAAARERAERLVGEVRRGNERLRDAKILAEEPAMREIFEVRDAALGLTSKVPNQPDYYPGWEDAAVAPEHLGSYLREFAQKMEEYGYRGAVYGHFGQACVHCSISFDLFSKDGVAQYRRFVTEMAHVVVKYGGSISGEHGDGQARGELLPIMYGDELVEAFWKFKTAFDPENKMNPGKVVRAKRLDEDLRWGADYDPWEPATKFAFANDQNSFAFAANRCVGAGVCRKHDKGTMCPSYMVSKEERYSTRGRARLLFEMLEGNPIRDGWKSEAVKESLDFCLACKGCKSECPVNVDIATYKAEFLYHYFKGKMRPLSAWLFGYMFVWAKLASLAPGVANFFTQAPPFAALLKRIASIDSRRRIPLFAERTFRDWYARRGPRNAGRERVVLWTDTWNNYFHPQTARAALEVLEDAGYHVLIPHLQICCGRPLYDYGLLDGAKRQLRAVLDELRGLVREGVCVVGLEPSCLSVFKDEMQDLLGDDADAARLAEQSFTLEAFLNAKAPHYRAPRLERRAIVHEHCHAKSVLAARTQSRAFETMGMDVARLESGCCGMAGAFGFERSHYDMSVACGERVLLPSVRGAKPETIVVADGFSCREQIAQTTNRQALHPAEVMRMAVADGGHERDDALPELRFVADSRARSRDVVRRGYTMLAVAGLTAAAVMLALRGRSG